MNFASQSLSVLYTHYLSTSGTLQTQQAASRTLPSTQGVKARARGRQRRDAAPRRGCSIG